MIQLPDDIVFLERGWLSSNNFLLIDDSQVCLVDTGYYTHAQQTEALVKSIIGDRLLTCIVNTHLHSDHCGGNSHLQGTYPHVRTLIPSGVTEHVAGWDEDALTYKTTGQFCPPFAFTDSLRSGDTFSVASKTWMALSAPGHDPHSIILFNETDGVLISADALWENGFGVVFPEIEGVDAFDEVHATLDLIAELAPRVVLPGHGKPFMDVDDALLRARSRLKQFTSSEDKHRDYAAKVLLKFKLLEFQKLAVDDFVRWASNTPYLQLLHAKYAPTMALDSWILSQCAALEKSHACKIEGDQIVNT